jgi:diaminopimelate epimerase
MRMFNADGSEAEMCGNAIRCVGKYLFDRRLAANNPIVVETGRGPLVVEIEADGGTAVRARVNMAPPILKSNEIPTALSGDPPIEAPIEVAGRKVFVTCVSMGNPHAVVFVDDGPNDEMVLGLGPKIEVHPAFPKKINVEFVRVVSKSEATMRVWERGSGETWACGTGACAVAVAGALTGRTNKSVLVHLRGGDLHIDWRDDGVYKTGPATQVFAGEVDLESF